MTRFGWALALALSTTAWAKEARPLTYQEAMQAALEGNPALRRARLDRDSADAMLLTSRGAFDPQFGLDGSWNQRKSRGFFQGFPFESESRSWDLGANLSSGQTLTGTSVSVNANLDRNFSSFVTNFGAIGQNAQIQDAYTSNLNVSLTQQLMRGLNTNFNLQNVTRARQGVTVAELSLERARQDALSQTAQSYWDWVYRERLREIAEQAEAVAEEALRVGALRVDAGELAPVERTRLEAARVQAQANAIDAATAARQAADALLLLIGRPPGTGITPAAPPGDARILEIDPNAAAEVALAQNLELAVARAELETAEMVRAGAKHARLPTLAGTVATGIGAQDDALGAAISGLVEEDAFPFVQVSGQLRVPLGNRAARGEFASSDVAVQQRRQVITDLEASLTAQVLQQVRVLEVSQRRVSLADANVRLAEQTLAAEQALAEAGRSIQRNVLEARAEVDRTRAEAAKARTDQRLAEVELLRLQGQLSED